MVEITVKRFINHRKGRQTPQNLLIQKSLITNSTWKVRKWYNIIRYFCNSITQFSFHYSDLPLIKEICFTTLLIWDMTDKISLNPFLPNVPILYPLKIPENLWFSGVFRGCKMGPLARNGLIQDRKRLIE